jgi:RNA polymerase sigma-70 factor, ECF subfamily
MTLQSDIDSTVSTLADADLLSRACRGDETAFEEIYRRHRDAVFKFSYRMLGSVPVAEDVTQDCFLVLLRNPDRFDPSRAALRTFLLAVARNQALKRLRYSGIEVDLDIVDAEVGSNGSASPLGEMLSSEVVTVVKAAIDRLPVLQREALVLFEYEGLSMAEIATIVDADIGTVKARLYRSRQALKRMLAPYIRGGNNYFAADEVHS